MKCNSALLLALILGVAVTVTDERSAKGQALGAGQSDAVATPALDVSLGFEHINANAPPGGCKCFGLNGGYISAEVHVLNWLSVEGEASGSHANDIGTLGQNLTLITYMGGLKVSRQGHRLVPFVDAMVGGAHGYDSYFPTGSTYTTAASSLAYAAGGGVDLNLGRRFAVRGFARFLQTEFPNNVDNQQNHLEAGGGIVVKLGRFYRKERMLRELPPPEEQISFSCSSSVSNIDQGDSLEVLGMTLTEPDHLDVTYDWTTTVGTLVGKGRRVLIDTMGVPAGEYHVVGHASVAGHPKMMADCDVPFRIKTAKETITSPAPPPPGPPVERNRDREFHENVPDILFDYDSAAIRPDMQAAVTHAAEYLASHPDIYVLIGGYADDRGSAEYNLGLGVKRSEAARKALIAAGVDPDRLQIVSYGKDVQVCTAENERCRQQNRRAAFAMHP